MTEAIGIQVKILSDPEFAEALRSEAQQSPGVIEIVSSAEEKNLTELGYHLGPGEWIGLIGIVRELPALARIIWHTLTRSKAKEIVVQTPLRTVHIHNSKELTEDEIKRILKQLLKL